METFIIAEIGVNHNGDVQLAEKLIKEMAKAGCNAVKFQTFQTKNLVTRTAEKAAYQKSNIGTSESQFDMLKKLELSESEFFYLKSICEQNSVEFMSTPFNESSVDMLEKIGVLRYKLSSGDITNKRLLQYVARTEKPMILSTGMCDLEEIKEAISWVKEIGNNKITLLHCTSNYPARFEDINMNALQNMKKFFGLPVGYSDHTKGIEISTMAVALGASVIEKHVTISKELPGPDHQASLDIAEFRQMVKSIRNIEKAFGNGEKTAAENEYNTRMVARKSIVVTRNLPEGHVLKAEDLDIKRPGDGIPPKYLDLLPGKKLLKNATEDTTLYFEDIEQ